MPLPQTCPACREPLPAAVDRCPNCQAVVLRAGGTGRRPLVLGVLALLGVGVATGAFLLNRTKPAEYADPRGLFTAQFPSRPTTTTVTTADPGMMRWGEEVTKAKSGGREFAVVVIDGLNPGDQEPGPAARDAQMKSVLNIASTNLDANPKHERPVTHDGHPGREVAFVGRGEGPLIAVRLVVGERAAVRMSVTGTGDRNKPEAFLDAAAAFFKTVRLGEAFGPPIVDDPPTVTAADLAAAYRADPKAADEKYKGRWVRVTGEVKSVPADGKGFEVPAGESTVAVELAKRGRMSVRVQPGPVIVTGKCAGATDGTKVALTDAIVGRPKPPEAGK